MSGRHVQVFSNGDPLLAPYLAHYLQAQTCNLLGEGGMFYLRSSYFKQLPLLPSSAQREQATKGLSAVLNLISPAFDTLSVSTKREECIQTLLFILNGALKLKYRKCGGLTRCKSVTPEVVERGTDYEVNNAGQRVSTGYRVVPVRFALTAGMPYFRATDRKQPSLKKIWNIAKRDGSVARTLYHYTNSEDLVELRKVVEEIMADTYIRPATKTGKVQFGDWNKQKWTEPEVKMNKMEAWWWWLHNRHLSNDRSLHAEPFSSIYQANTLKATGTTMSLPEARDIVHTILMKWVSLKP